jgi:putative PIN family toxin of toxin-antitoxin system
VRVLLDVNILVRANEKSSGPARALLLELIAGKHVLLTNAEILIELARVLRYPRLRSLFGLSEQDIYSYVQFLKSAFTLVPNSLARSRAPIGDAADVHVLEAAINGAADVICTLDSDFYLPEVVGWCQTMGITILDDVALLSRLKT